MPNTIITLPVTSETYNAEMVLELLNHITTLYVSHPDFGDIEQLNRQANDDMLSMIKLDLAKQLKCQSIQA